MITSLFSLLEAQDRQSLLSSGFSIDVLKESDRAIKMRFTVAVLSCCVMAGKSVDGKTKSVIEHELLLEEGTVDEILLRILQGNMGARTIEEAFSRDRLAALNALSMEVLQRFSVPNRPRNAECDRQSSRMPQGSSTASSSFHAQAQPDPSNGGNFRGSMSPLSEHPLDRQYLIQLRACTGLEFALNKIRNYKIEDFLRFDTAASCVQAQPATFPEICGAFEKACKCMDVDVQPLLYFKHIPEGVSVVDSNGFIVVADPSLLQGMPQNELLFLFGHVLGHISFGHALYLMLSDALPMLTETTGAWTLGLSSVMAKNLKEALAVWKPLADYSADRAGLLCCQDIHAALSVLLKLANLPTSGLVNAQSVVESFANQAKMQGRPTPENLDVFLKYASYRGLTSWSVLRAKELLEWYLSEQRFSAL